MRIRPDRLFALASASLFLSSPVHAFGTSDAWADAVVSYSPGGADPAYTSPGVTLGQPERFTGEGAFPSVVSMFSPPFGTDEIVQVGPGGWLEVEFENPVTDDPSNLYGVDLLIFGNGGFIDVDFPNGRIGPTAAMFGTDPMRISISPEGTNWFTLAPVTEGVFPTQGYLDSGPFDGVPGSIPTDFTRPMNPALTPADFAGLSYAGALALYDGSGGGTPIDIAPSGFSEVRYVRVEPLGDGWIEIDAFAAVPEPGAATLLLGGMLSLALLGKVAR